MCCYVVEEMRHERKKIENVSAREGRKAEDTVGRKRKQKAGCLLGQPRQRAGAILAPPTPNPDRFLMGGLCLGHIVQPQCPGPVSGKVDSCFAGAAPRGAPAATGS